MSGNSLSKREQQIIKRSMNMNIMRRKNIKKTINHMYLPMMEKNPLKYNKKLKMTMDQEIEGFQILNHS